jgi:hypothetical protein
MTMWRVIVFCPQEIVWGTAADWVGILIAFATVVAGLLTYRHQSNENRKQMRMAQRPHLDTYFMLDDVALTFSLEVRNDGVGPAFVKKFRAFIGDKELDTDIDTIWIDAVRPYGGQEFAVEGGVIEDGTVIPVGVTSSLMKITPLTDRARNSGPLLDRFRKDLRLEIEYESAFQDKYSARYPSEQLARGWAKVQEEADNAAAARP